MIVLALDALSSAGVVGSRALKSRTTPIGEWGTRVGHGTQALGELTKAPTNASPGIEPGAYEGTFSLTGHKGRAGVRLENGGNVPTLGPNPAQGGNTYAKTINIHEGYSLTNRGSAGCITISPQVPTGSSMSYADQMWFSSEARKYTVTVMR